MSGYILRILACYLFDRPKVETVIKQGAYKGRGDYADEWGECARCGKLCHRDQHIFGDGTWRHFQDTRP